MQEESCCPGISTIPEINRCNCEETSPPVGGTGTCQMLLTVIRSQISFCVSVLLVLSLNTSALCVTAGRTASPSTLWSTDTDRISSITTASERYAHSSDPLLHIQICYSTYTDLDLVTTLAVFWRCDWLFRMTQWPIWTTPSRWRRSTWTSPRCWTQKVSRLITLFTVIYYTYCKVTILDDWLCLHAQTQTGHSVSGQ